ncbi:MAG: cytochrome P450 [Actinomycetota bacterium]|nr:cytochrome P450 [Actinomycetota bacterium]
MLLQPRKGSSQLPPGPSAPAAVNTAVFVRRPLETLTTWQRRYGDFFTVGFLVFGTGVNVADPAAIKELFTGDQSDLRAGEANEPLSPIVGSHSVLTLDGPEHMRQRKLLLPPFQGSAVHAFRKIIREVSEREVAGWAPGSKLVLRDRMRSLTFEVICRAVFGVTERERVERLRLALLPIMDTGVGVIFMPRALRRELGGFGPWGRLQRRLRAADALLYEEIERRRTASDLEARSDVLSLLLRARDEEGRPMSPRELRDELMTMLAAGHETTATGLAFAFDLLLRNPEKLSRLREELASGGDAYLNATVTESLRLRPVIDASERTLTKPRTLGGFELPPGIRVYPAIALVHRREDLYPQADEFRPERFLDDGAESYSWLPFGGGIRRCIGAALAQAEMAEVIRCVVSRVELEPIRTEPEPIVLRGITLAPRHGTPVRVASVA